MKIFFLNSYSGCLQGISIGLVLAAILAVSGCSHIEVIDHYDLNSQQLQTYKNLQIVTEDQRSRGDYRSIGEIFGLSCAKILGQSANELNAIEQVRLRASLAGSHAISPPVCVHSADTDWNNNCWDSVICSSEVLVERVYDPQPPSD
jgi:hypothetical protein